MKIIGLSILLLIILIIIFKIKSSESFTIEFDKSQPTTQLLQYLDMGDHRTVVQLQRGTNGNTVILLHNSPMNFNIWQPLFQTIQKYGLEGQKIPNLVAYDLRGHGTAWLPIDIRYNDNNNSNHAWSLETFANDCKNVYDKIIGGGKVYVCGFGFGGLVAQQYALMYPDTVKKLILLQTSITPLESLQDEINELVKWINLNTNITYLTNKTDLVDKTMCQSFYLPTDKRCKDINSTTNEMNIPIYNLVETIFRESSATTLLQTDKLVISTNLINKWTTIKVNFPIHILAAKDDPIAPPEKMIRTYTTIYNNNRQLTVVLDIVEGRYGFSITYPEYIANILIK
jgi:pimeloyl-ACP methyl ester carboxylesterase